MDQNIQLQIQNFTFPPCELHSQEIVKFVDKICINNKCQKYLVPGCSKCFELEHANTEAHSINDKQDIKDFLESFLGLVQQKQNNQPLQHQNQQQLDQKVIDSILTAMKGLKIYANKIKQEMDTFGTKLRQFIGKISYKDPNQNIQQNYEELLQAKNREELNQRVKNLSQFISFKRLSNNKMILYSESNQYKREQELKIAKNLEQFNFFETSIRTVLKTMQDQYNKLNQLEIENAPTRLLYFSDIFTNQNINITTNNQQIRLSGEEHKKNLKDDKYSNPQNSSKKQLPSQTMVMDAKNTKKNFNIPAQCQCYQSNPSVSHLQNKYFLTILKQNKEEQKIINWKIKIVTLTNSIIFGMINFLNTKNNHFYSCLCPKNLDGSLLFTNAKQACCQEQNLIIKNIIIQEKDIIYLTYSYESKTLQLYNKTQDTFCQLETQSTYELAPCVGVKGYGDSVQIMEDEFDFV